MSEKLKIDFIAEIGVNHEGSIKNSLMMIDMLSVHGGITAKFQIYKAERLASDFANAYWDTSQESTLSQKVLFKKYDVLGKSEYEAIKNYCDLKNVEFMATFFDTDSLREMQHLVKRFKVASADITNFELLYALASFEKPVILSTGAASMEEVEQAIAFLVKNGVTVVSLLHCVLNYPTEKQNAHLARISVLRNRFPQLVVGYSDHTKPDPSFEIQLSAILIGARILEKHFTFDKTLPGNDHYHAFDSKDLQKFMERLSNLATLLSYDELEFLNIQRSARQQARRGLFFKRDLRNGEIIREFDVISLRPVQGLPASQFFEVLGKKLRRDVKALEPISSRDFY